jgi:hypothetical protein
VIGYPLLKLRIAAAHLLFPVASQNIDVAVLGYPKTGNTWFSMQLRKLLIGHYGLSDDCLKNIMPESIRGLLTHRNSNVPTIFVNHNLPYFHLEDAKRMKLNHKPFEGKKVIILIREAKDTLVSLFMHGRYREEWYKKDISQFVFDSTYGIEKYVQYYKQIARDLSLFESYLVVRYEDFHEKPFDTLQKVADFIGLNKINDDVINDAISFSSFTNMRTIEKEGGSQSWSMRTPKDQTNQNAFKARKGKVGGYKDHLNEKLASQIDQYTEKLPDLFRY